MDGENMVIRHSGIDNLEPKETFSLNASSMEKIETAISSLELLREKVDPQPDSEIDKEFKAIETLLKEANKLL